MRGHIFPCLRMTGAIAQMLGLQRSQMSTRWKEHSSSWQLDGSVDCCSELCYSHCWRSCSCRGCIVTACRCPVPLGYLTGADGGKGDRQTSGLLLRSCWPLLLAFAHETQDLDWRESLLTRCGECVYGQCSVDTRLLL